MNRVCVLKWAVLATMFLLVIGSVQADEPEATPTPDQPMIGELAPAFSLMDLDDQMISSDDLRGSYVVIHIAASW